VRLSIFLRLSFSPDKVLFNVFNLLFTSSKAVLVSSKFLLFYSAFSAAAPVALLYIVQAATKAPKATIKGQIVAKTGAIFNHKPFKAVEKALVVTVAFPATIASACNAVVSVTTPPAAKTACIAFFLKASFNFLLANILSIFFF
jgi:hypothetical protein